MVWQISVIEMYMKYRYLDLSTVICPIGKPVHGRQVKDRQRTRNVTIRRFRSTIVAVEKQ